MATPSVAATWQTGVNYGGTTVMDLYVPTTVDASPGIVVALHYCGGNSSNAHSWFQALSDQYGFIIIAPSAGGSCFDATPARSGERDAISKMVTYVVTQKQADATRVFAAGASSGACMTYALLAAYPDVFAAGSSLAAVPAGAWTGGNAYGWTTPAGTTAQQWGDKVRNADPGFTGTRPRVQLWHGMQDTTLTYSQNFPAEVAQWTNVLGVSDADATASSFQGSQDTWARKSYKDASGKEVLETNTAPNAPHDLTGRGLWTDVVRFFGLDMDSTTTGGGGTGGGGPTAGTGGAAGGGGRANGGAANTGGTAMSGAGGASSGTGGTSTGGTTSAAGTTGAAGATGTAGSVNATGGTASGGASSSSAGNSAGGAKGGASGSPTAGSGSPDSSGCGCIVAGAGQPPHGALVGLLVAGLGALVRRRQRAALASRLPARPARNRRECPPRDLFA